MNHHERAAYLFREAIKQGLDGPTEGMLVDAFGDVQANTETEIADVLIASGKFADAATYLEQQRELRELEDAE